MIKGITKEDVLTNEARLYEAIKSRDIDELDALLHNDLLFIIPSGEVITKEIDLQTYRDGALQVDKINATVEELNIIDDSAVITLVMELKGRAGNVSFDARFRYIRFWKRFDDGIKVIGGSGRAL
ncbi:nuclear transport factor 2 family protein [Dyadobacter aurulentus]|uniref:nuclear transport factor 2 family protein n=1 Tax=Dyadobacter sp. UC 10 TaxID=2605428 RepID=UPI0011F0DC35|nr:nuclear transport factor 2 family protein [Dyadobacter sp. UC 10]KAA0993361.1 nuclear transport factor 2 family protein [Dyadobacter sp. UC 10]